jgi:2,3,4,5-tetrahydropyridine-2,6-dicarboxylate N-succinyltransferase
MTDGLFADLQSGRVRAASPDPSASDGWRVDASVKEAILDRFRDRRERTWSPEESFAFVDREALAPRTHHPDGVRVVPGGTSIRDGTYLGTGVVVMPPSYVNVGAWIGPGTMVDSHVLVGSCAQIGADVHLAAGVVIGGVLEPPGARPVIVEDEAFIGAGCILLEGVLVQRRAVLAAGVTLTATSRLYDLAEERVITGTVEQPLVVPGGSVVIPGTRRLDGAFAGEHGLSAATAIIVKRRDAGTDARTALEDALR